MNTVNNGAGGDAPTKWEDFGLINQDGQFNCFVNVVIQAFWHLDYLR